MLQERLIQVLLFLCHCLFYLTKASVPHLVELPGVGLFLTLWAEPCTHWPAEDSLAALWRRFPLSSWHKESDNRSCCLAVAILRPSWPLLVHWPVALDALMPRHSKPPGHTLSSRGQCWAIDRVRTGWRRWAKKASSCVVSESVIAPFELPAFTRARGFFSCVQRYQADSCALQKRPSFVRTLATSGFWVCSWLDVGSTTQDKLQAPRTLKPMQLEKKEDSCSL